ncbi:hypothetical protein GCM10023197_46600 [Gordonia humi]|uniref:Mutator family transposase n=1 Tax=Gordonia humi TaxID=686429 RepID=A0A840F6G2_9ACTN|nr:transposase-like protein [Gordonia humi]
MDLIYPVIFVDAIVVRVRDGQVRNTAFYVVMGVTVNGEREILGIWAGEGAEGARFWLQVFTELKNRGVEDVLIAVRDGLKGLSEAINTTWEQTVVQQCIVHLIRNSFRYAGRQHRDAIVKAIKPVARPRPRLRRKTGSPSGATGIPRSCSSGATVGRSSCRSLSTTSRSRSAG